MGSNAFSHTLSPFNIQIKKQLYGFNNVHPYVREYAQRDRETGKEDKGRTNNKNQHIANVYTGV